MSAGESLAEALAPGTRQAEQTRGTSTEAKRGDHDCAVALIKDMFVFKSIRLV